MEDQLLLKKLEATISWESILKDKIQKSRMKQFIWLKIEFKKLILGLKKDIVQTYTKGIKQT